MQFDFKINEINKDDRTQYLCGIISTYLKENDTILLWGDLGSGKTFFSSHFINYLATKYLNLSKNNSSSKHQHNDNKIIVQSPTFNLTYEYELDNYNIQHYDFYRLHDYEEIMELGYEENLEEKLLLIEWPERLGDNLPKNRLDIIINYLENEDGRQFTLKAYGNWIRRLQRLIKLEHFLGQHGFAGCERRGIFQDASLRRYERIFKDNKSYILMDFPAINDEFNNFPNLDELLAFYKKSDRAYNVKPYIFYTNYFAKIGLNVPEILYSDDENGFLIIEDFGDYAYNKLVHNSKTQHTAYEVAIDNLILKDQAYMQKTASDFHPTLDFKSEILSDDAILIIDFYNEDFTNKKIDPKIRHKLKTIWKSLFAENSLSLTISFRDYHSPNLFWLENEQGLHKCGIIDFQDAFIAPCAYDLVSLLQDGRIYFDEEYEKKNLKYYLSTISADDETREQFIFEYNLCAAQRASKNLGIFIKLAKRDNKLKYLKHLGTNLEYLKRALNHPKLKDIKNIYNKLGLLDENNLKIILSKYHIE